MAYRMLVVDLDGTVIPWDRPIHERDIRAAHALREAGIALTIATGRIHSGAIDAARALGVVGSIASVNGSHREDVQTGEVLDAHPLSDETRSAMSRVAHAHDLAPVLLTAEDVFHGPRSERLEPFLRRWSERLVPHDEVTSMPAWANPAVLAALGFGHADAVERAAAALERETHEALEVAQFRVFDSEHAAMKVRVRGTDKGTALLRLAAERGIAASETVAVGDWHNDIPMLRTAGLSFAMAQAESEVAAHADEVLVSDGRTGGAIAEIARRVFGVF